MTELKSQVQILTEEKTVLARMVDELASEKESMQTRIERYQKDIKMLVHRLTANTLSSLKHHKQPKVNVELETKQAIIPEKSSSEFSRESDLEEETTNLVPEDER